MVELRQRLRGLFALSPWKIREDGVDRASTTHEGLERRTVRNVNARADAHAPRRSMRPGRQARRSDALVQLSRRLHHIRALLRAVLAPPSSPRSRTPASHVRSKARAPATAPAPRPSPLRSGPCVLEVEPAPKQATQPGTRPMVVPPTSSAFLPGGRLGNGVTGAGSLTMNAICPPF